MNVLKNILACRLYQFIYDFSFGNEKKKFKIKLKALKTEIIHNKNCYPDSVRTWITWYKNKQEWHKNNNTLIFIDDFGREHNIFYYKGLNIEFKEKNSKIIIHHPCYFKNLQILLSSNCTVTIHKKFYNNDFGSVQLTEPFTSVTIGENCLFAYMTSILTTDYHTIADSKNKILNKPQDIIIGNHVWLGNGCIILKGSYIPDNSIIGIHSVYTAKSYVPHSDENCIGLNGKIFMGNPAKCVKQGDFTWHLDNCTAFAALHPQITEALDHYFKRDYAKSNEIQ